MALTETTPLAGCSDRILRGKSVSQIQNETAQRDVYVSKTVTIGESATPTEAQRIT